MPMPYPTTATPAATEKDDQDVNTADSTASRARYDEAALDALSTQGDPLADETVATLIRRGEVGDLNTLMRFFGTAGDELPDRLPASARDYFEATALPPGWVDWDVMEQARLFFMDNAAHINTGLSFAAMPVTYAVPRMARLLSSTHSIAYPSRRMANTGQFVTYLMRGDAFAQGSRFIPAAQKVRLLHAAVRHHLSEGGHWDVERHGLPICQEDMIAGFGMFSLLVLDATPSPAGWRSRADPGTPRRGRSRCSSGCWRPSRTAVRSPSGPWTRRARCSPGSNCPR